jgi:polysaccharide biosynthesis transport protein
MQLSDFASLLRWHEFKQLVHENKKFIGACLAIALVFGLAYLVQSTPAYESKMTVEVEYEVSKILNIDDIRKQDLQKQESLKTIEQNLQSAALLRRVIRNHHLADESNFLLSRDERKLSESQLADSLSKMLTVKLRRGTRLIDIAVRHPDREMSLKLVSSVVHEFIRQDLEQNTGSAQNAFSFLMEEASRLQVRLRKSEQSIQEYRSSEQHHIDEIRKKRTEHEAELTLLSTRYKERHPRLVHIRTQLAACQASMDKVSKQNPKKANIYASYEVLSREYEADRILYENVLKRMKETQVAQSIAASTIRSPSPAVTSQNPIQPGKLRTLGLSVGTGLFFAFGLLFSRNALRGALRTIDQAESLLQLPVLAAIPQDKIPFELPHRSLLLAEKPASATSEAFRSLRTSLALANKSHRRKVNLFAGAIPSEGKSFCAANYALSLAQQGVNTLLIDADLRRPMLDEMFPNVKNSAGVTDFLLGNKILQDVVAETSTPHLSVIPVGTHVVDPTELLARSRFGELIKEALNYFEQIVIDTPPLLSVADTLLMAEHADAIFLVVHAGKTPRKAVQRAIAILERANLKPAGIILNGVAPESQDSSYYYHYESKRKALPTIYSLPNHSLTTSA